MPPVQLRELYELLCANYVEDDDASFRFQYSAEFLRWCVRRPISISCWLSLRCRALKPPGYHQEWHVAVRVASTKKLVAFIAGMPINVRVREK